MVAPKGNQFWITRRKHGRDPLYKSSTQLWKLCLEYFTWVESHPLKEEKVFCYQGEITKTTINKLRAMTIRGLCLYLDISVQTWKNYKDNKDFLDIITRAEEIIREQKFTGAAADLLNPNIIARDLGLSDKKELEISDKKVSEMTEAELDAIIAEG